MWCSAPLPSENEVTCPTCGAKLVGEGDDQVPGVTAIDAAAIISASRGAKPVKRSRWMSWISGEYTEDEQPAPPGSLAPPPANVRREMLRLELEAQVANLQGEATAMAADQAVEAVDAGASPTAAAAEAAELIAVTSDAIAAAAPAEALEVPPVPEDGELTTEPVAETAEATETVAAAEPDTDTATDGATV
jgi:hypothetical protein